MARLILTEAGEDVDVGGNVAVIGTRSGGEVITVLRGVISLDASFNAGGDTVRLPEDAGSFTIRMSGAQAIFEGPGIRVTIPVGASGIDIAFRDSTRILLFDTARNLVRLGEQTINATLAPVRPEGPTPSLTGTEAADYLTGTFGDDVIDGLGGNDILDGSAGNDIIRGGLGDDSISGSLGSDQLFGGAGADHITDVLGLSVLVDGGTGNDYLEVVNGQVTSLQLLGGDGDDYISVFVNQPGTASIDAGPGADFLMLASHGMNLSVTLGAGRDEVMLAEDSLVTGSWGVITLLDFGAGAAGEKVDLLSALVSGLANWDQGTDPFRSGHLRLIDRSGQAVLQLDRDGPTSAVNGFKDLILFTGVSRDALTKENFKGFDPRSTAQASLATSTSTDTESEDQPGSLPDRLGLLPPSALYDVL